MKTAVWISSLTIVLLLSSCFGPSGPDMDEDYAGNWHVTSGNMFGTEEIIELTDTTYSYFIRYTDGNYYPAARGFIKKTSDTTLYIVTYEIFIFDDAWADSSYIYPNRDDGEYKSVDHVIDNNMGDDLYNHYANMITDSEMSYGWSGDSLVIDTTTYTPSDPISDSFD